MDDASKTWQERTGKQNEAADPTFDWAAFERDSLAERKAYLKKLRHAVAEKAVTPAALLQNPLCRWGQEQLDHMRQHHPAWKDTPVTLYIHHDQPVSPTNPDFWPVTSAMALTPQTIHMGDGWRDTTLQNDPTKLRAILAHELAHSINGDNTPKGDYIWEKTPKTHVREILANRMGAILYGNPKAFGEAYCSIGERPETPTHPSTAQMRLQCARWAELLEQQGVLDGAGNVVDYTKAFALFENAKHTAIIEYETRLGRAHGRF